MRKYRYIFYVAALAVLSGCSKDDQGAADNSQDDLNPVEVKTITFEASLGVDVKTSLGVLSDGKMPLYWSEGDKLAAVAGSSGFYADIAVSVNQDDARKCSFSIKDMSRPAEGDRMSFFYPSEGVTPIGGAICFTLSSSQKCDGDALPVGENGPLAAAVADVGSASDVYDDGGASLSFRNVFALLAFRFPEADISSVTFAGKGNETVAGVYTVAADGALSNVSSESKSIVLKPSEGTSFKAGKTYYMAVAPQSFDDGFTLAITTSAGVTYEQSTSKKLVLNASDIKGLGGFSTPSDLPMLAAGTPGKSWYMVYVPMTLTSDGGNGACEVGICWKPDGNSGATVNDRKYTYQFAVSEGGSAFGSATWLDYGKTYKLRPWVKYGDKIAYYPEVEGKLEDNPSALNPSWTDITSSYSMPSTIRLYKTTTTVTGRNVNAWYAIADMSKGDLELRTVKNGSVTTPNNAIAYKVISNVYVLTNGGFFDSSQSYSYVMNRGSVQAGGVKAVTRDGVSYPLTRGAFGVNSSQVPSVKWLYGSNEWAYDMPLPAYNTGNNTLVPTDDYPSARQTWDVYSAIGGGPVLLYDGRLPFDYLLTRDTNGSNRYIGNPEMLQDDIFGPSVLQPRTAIGHTEDGKIVLMVVDGRNAGGSQGVTLDELARLMKGVGCTYALNLDGGGSSVMRVSNGQTPATGIVQSSRLNTPSDGSDRDVMTFVAITKK